MLSYNRARVESIEKIRFIELGVCQIRKREVVSIELRMCHDYIAANTRTNTSDNTCDSVQYTLFWMTYLYHSQWANRARIKWKEETMIRENQIHDNYTTKRPVVSGAYIFGGVLSRPVEEPLFLNSHTNGLWWRDLPFQTYKGVRNVQNSKLIIFQTTILNFYSLHAI